MGQHCLKEGNEQFFFNPFKLGFCLRLFFECEKMNGVLGISVVGF